jgi:uncharacterized protein (DUF885 family)
MLSIEGYAVYAEHRMRDAGFYDEGPEQLFFAFCDVLRAVRVILDLSLQTGAMSADDAARFVADTTLMSEGWAHTQIVRALRVPLQGLTYRVGCTSVQALRAEAERRARRARRPFDELAFHDAFFSLGPVPPTTVRDLECAPAPPTS